MPKCEECGSEHETEFGVKMHRSHTHLETIEDYFWDKVDKAGPDECWEWTGCINSYGYGSLKLNDSHMIASRVYVTQIKGIELSGNVCVCHHCDNRKCVNPNHIYVGTVQDNIDDVYERNDMKGENCANSKLKNEQVKEIYLASKNSDLSYGEISKDYPVSENAIRRIGEGETWTHITCDLDNNQN